MIQIIKKYRYSVAVAILMIVMTITSQVLMAQPPPPPPPSPPPPRGAPIDGGVLMLISACIGYGYKKLRAS
jgi:hypothetical protein